MEKPSLNNIEAMFQAGDTMKTYLNRAVRDVDEVFGEGYAHDNPALVAACISAQAADYEAATNAAALYEIAEAIGNAGAAVAAPAWNHAPSATA
jgi:hypothetical protein